MRLAAEPAWRCVVAEQLDDVPEANRALFGGDPFSTLGWYRATVATALSHGAQACFVQVMQGDRPMAVLPMQRLGRSLAALTTPYTVLWRPLVAPGLDQASLRHVARVFGRFCGPFGTVRLDCMEAQAAAWTKSCGLRALRFAHFGNWHATLAAPDWSAYLASRPGRLREAIRRRSRRLMQDDGAALHVVQGPAGLEQAIGDFEAVYGRSWKEPEPSPLFNPALMRQCATDGSLRLGILRVGETPLAAQFWVVQGGHAFVLKLAHDEASRSRSPGTVLTALMIRHLLEQDRVTGLDFGRGDDAYKAMWTDRRRQRVGVVLADLRYPAGIVALGRHLAGRTAAIARGALEHDRFRLTRNPDKHAL